MRHINRGVGAAVLAVSLAATTVACGSPEDGDAPGMRAVEADGVRIAADADLVIVSIPQKNVPDLAAGVVDARKPGAPVIETNNYYPQQRDGEIAAIEDGLTESAWVAEQIGAPVYKVFNGIWWKHLLESGKPRGAADRIALPVAGDDGPGRDLVHDARQDRQGQVAHAVHADVGRRHPVLAERGVDRGHDRLVGVRPDGDDPGAAAGRGLVELLHQPAAGPQLSGERRRQQVGGEGAGVRRAERRERVDPLVTTEAGDVVAGDDPTQAVRDDVDPLVARLLDDRLDLLRELGGGGAHVLRERSAPHARAPMWENRALVSW